MALRVLLADESVTIKKVFQLALQDFAVDVTTVNVGLDVVQVAQKINPDIIFADVLLQKKNGYDVSREIKSHPELAHIPVVLIWSGFMELDEARYKSSGASAHLEKPFDTQHLRKLVQTLVPKTSTQPLSAYLQFPKLPDFAEEPRPARSTENKAPASEMAPPPFPLPPTQSPKMQKTEPMPPTPSKEWTMDNFENIEHTNFPPIPPLAGNDEAGEEFVAVQLPSEPVRAKINPPPGFEKFAEREEESAGGQWVQKTLTNFKLAPEKRTEQMPPVTYNVPQEKIDPDEFLPNTWSGKSGGAKTTSAPQPPKLNQQKNTPVDLNDDQEFELDLSDNETQKSTSKSVTPKTTSTIGAQLSEQELETIIRAQAKEVIEKVVWQVVPEIATRIIERELERLLKERNSL